MTKVTNNPVSGKTAVLGIIGYPVRHSLSPVMQNAALAAAGLDYIYVPFEVEPEHLEAAVYGMRALSVAGFNVTIPHKTGIMGYLDELDESAAAAGAVNTVVNDSGRLVGYNTDGDGLVRSLADDLAFDPRGRSVVVAGAGGAARGAVAALCRHGAREISIVNRTRERALDLAADMTARYPDTKLQAVSSLEGCDRFDLLLNTTSLGMRQESVPWVDLSGFAAATAVYDMVYTPAVTPLLHRSRELGLRSANGLGMLIAQGELAFTLWTGEEPPQYAMKQALAPFMPA